MLDYLNPHPRGWQNPVTARASAALPAAGAWDATPTEFFVSGARWMQIQFTYTRGGQGQGAFDWQLESSIYSVAALVPAGAGEWGDQSIFLGGPVALGADTQSRVQQDYETYGSKGAAAETFTFGPIEIDRAIERIRIPARESADGETGSPGTLAIVVELW